MKANYRLKKLTTLLVLVMTAAGCAAGARQAYKRGTLAESTRDYTVALEQYRQALASDPANIEYRMKYEQTRFTLAYSHFQNGRRALAAGDAATAKTEFQRAIDIDPTHDFARDELADAERMLQSRAQNRPAPTLDYERLATQNLTNPNLGAQMRTNLTERIEVHMTGPSRNIYENLAKTAGLQVIFGRNFRPTNATIDLLDVNIFEALDLVAIQTGTFWQPVNETTFVVMEDTQQNRRDFEDNILKTIYLTNITATNDLNQIMNVLRTALSLRGIMQSELQNAIIIHDTPSRVAMAERIIRALDKAKAEVVIDAIIMEVDKNTLRDLGISPPSSTVLGFTAPGASANSNTTTDTVNLRDLNNINSGSFSVTVPDSVARFLATRAEAGLVQNPRIRTTDGITASLRIGSEVPVPTTSIQNNNFGGGATTAYTLQQVGVQLDIVSKVLLNREISLQVTVQLRSLAGDRAVGDLLIPVFTNRVVAHTIRLAEGETNILGGIISNTETVTITGVPGLKDVPFLRFLFSQERKTRDQAEVIIMLTPHIVRMPDITEDDIRSVLVGGENNLRLRPDYGSPEPLPLAPRPAPAAPGPTSSTAPAAPPTPTTASLRFAQAPVTLASQGQTAVNLSIDGPNILGTDLTLTYDPAAFSIRDIREGGFLSRDGQVIAQVQNIDNQKGVAKVVLERSPTAPLVSGSGTLVTLMLEPGTKKGSSSLRVSEFGVRDARVLHPGGPAELQITVP
jgi:general secretion pathway protein D